MHCPYCGDNFRRTEAARVSPHHLVCPNPKCGQKIRSGFVFAWSDNSDSDGRQADPSAGMAEWPNPNGYSSAAAVRVHCPYCGDSFVPGSTVEMHDGAMWCPNLKCGQPIRVEVVRARADELSGSVLDGIPIIAPTQALKSLKV